MDGQNDNFSYDEAVDRIAEKYGVPKAVYRKMLGQESGDTDSAVSQKGAFSAWQIMPATARGLGYDPEELRREPLKAAEGGLRILRDNYKQFRQHAENEKHAWMMSVAGYHGNPANVLKDIKRGGYGLPDISDGAITTKQHVLKIFDGLTSDMFDRSPLGQIQTTNQVDTSPDQPRAVAVNPDDLPTVSLSPLEKQTLKSQKPIEQIQPPINQTFNNPVAPITPLPAPPLPSVQSNPMVIEPVSDVQTPGLVQPPAPPQNPATIQEPVVDNGITGYPNRRPNITGYNFEKTGKFKLDDGSELELIKDEINRYEPNTFRFRDKNGQVLVANVEDDGETAKISFSPETPVKSNSDTLTEMVKEPNQPPQNLDSEYKTYSDFVASQGKQPMTFEKFQKLVGETPDLKATATARLDAPVQQSAFSPSADANSPRPTKGLQTPTNYVPASAEAYKNEVYANKPFAKVYRQKPTPQQVIDDSTRENYGDNLNEVAEAYKRVTGINLLEPNDLPGLQADIDQYWNPQTGEYDVPAESNPIYKEVREVVEAYNKGGESAVRELVAKPVDAQAGINSKPRLTRTDDELRELAKQNVSENAFIPGFTTTDADIEAEYQRLKGIELSEDEAQDYAEKGRLLKENPELRGNTSPDAAIGIYKFLGGASNLIAGAARPFASLGLIEDAAYQEMSKLGQGATIFANAAKHDDLLGDVGEFVGQTSLEIPKYIAMSALPGGAIAAFGLDSALQSSGRGETLKDVGKEAIKGAILGGIFQGAGKLSQMAEKGTLKRLLPPGDIAKVEAGALEGNFSSNVGKRVLVSKLFGEGTRIGSVGGGVMTLELASGEDVETALKKAAVMTLFDVVMHGKRYGEIKDLAGKVFRVSKNGKTADVTVEPNGEVRLLKGNVPDRVVEAEFNADKIVDVEMDAKGVYRTKGDTAPIRETSIKTRNPQLETGLQTSKAADSASLTKPPSAIAGTSVSQGLIKSGISGNIETPQNATFRNTSEPIEPSQKLPKPGIAGEAIKLSQKPIELPESSLDLNMPEAPKQTTTRRSLDAERLTELDKRRADLIDSEFNMVSGKSVAELIDNAKIEYKNGTLFTNAEGTEIIRQADYVAFSDADGSNFYGRYLNPKNSERVEKALDLTFGSVRFTDPSKNLKLKRFIGEYRRALQSSPLRDVRQVVTANRAPYGLKAARQEETAHGKDYAVGFEHRVSSNIFKDDKIGRRAMRHLGRTAYTGLSKEVLGREVGAKIWLDTATKDLNLKDVEINHLRDLYTESILKNGRTSKDAEIAFSGVSRSARNYLKEKGQNEQSGTDRGAIERPSISGVGRTRRTSDTRGEGAISGTSQETGKTSGRESTGTTRESKLKELPLFERKYIERVSEGNKDLAERVAGEVLHSKSAALSKKMTVGDFAIDLTNMPKALKASVDLSAAGRQGLIAAIPHPIIASRSFGKQLGALASANYHKKFIEGLENHPFREMAEKSGLYISSLTDGSVNSREEQFMSRILGDDKFFENNKGEIARKGATFPIRASERAYSTFLDDLRINVFADLARQVHSYNQREGITDNETYRKQLEGVAKFVNYSTGRGSLGRFESAGEFLNIPFFSARYWASRFQVVNPAFYKNLPPGARKAVMKDFGIFLGAMVSIFTLLKLSGADITVNPFSPDFLKLRVGQYSYDLSGGMVQQIRYLAQTTINVGTGEIKDAISGTGRYIRSKLAPVPSSLYNLGTGTNFIGEPVTVKGEALGLISPISVEQVYEGAEKDGLLGVLQSSADIFGVGTTRYDNSLEVGEKLAEAERRLAGAKTKEEEQAIYTEVKAWRDLYYRAKKQPGELPPYPGRAEDEEPEQDEFIKDDIGEEPEEKRDIKVPLAEMIKFYDEKNKTLFSFAKDELESLIIQRAEYLNMRGRLTEKDLKEVRRIIPEYEPSDDLHPGVDNRPEKLKKIPLKTLSNDLPKPPKPPRMP